MLMTEIKKRFTELVNAYRDDEQILTLIEANMNAIGAYVNEVYNFETHLPIWRALNVPDENIQKRDDGRRQMHNKAIDATRQLVEFAKDASIAPIYDGSLEDRHEIANFCEKVVLTFFAGRNKFKAQNIDNYEQIAHEPVKYY